MIPTDRQRKKIAAEAKGKRLELQVMAWLESRGWLVEMAGKVARRYFDSVAGVWKVRSQRHDLFNVWDGLAVLDVGPDRQLSYQPRSLYQVTTLTNVAHKRQKIGDAGFPATSLDRIYAYVGRPGRWRILYGPDFSMPGESIIMGGRNGRRDRIVGESGGASVLSRTTRRHTVGATPRADATAQREPRQGAPAANVAHG